MTVRDSYQQGPLMSTPSSYTKIKWRAPLLELEVVLHTAIHLPTLYSSSLHWQYLPPSKAFAFISQGNKLELLTSPLTKEYYLGLVPWTNR